MPVEDSPLLLPVNKDVEVLVLPALCLPVHCHTSCHDRSINSHLEGFTIIAIESQYGWVPTAESVKPWFLGKEEYAGEHYAKRLNLLCQACRNKIVVSLYKTWGNCSYLEYTLSAGQRWTTFSYCWVCIFYCHFFEELSNIPLCKSTAFSLSSLLFRAIPSPTEQFRVKDLKDLENNSSQLAKTCDQTEKNENKNVMIESNVSTVCFHFDKEIKLQDNTLVNCLIV